MERLARGAVTTAAGMVRVTAGLEVATEVEAVAMAAVTMDRAETAGVAVVTVPPTGVAVVAAEGTGAAGAGEGIRAAAAGSLPRRRSSDSASAAM